MWLSIRGSSLTVNAWGVLLCLRGWEGCLLGQGLAQELRRRLGLHLFNFDLLRPSPNQPGARA